MTKNTALDNADRWAEMADKLEAPCVRYHRTLSDMLTDEEKEREHHFCCRCHLAKICRKNEHDNKVSAGEEDV